MKKLIYPFSLPLTLAAVACGGKSGGSDKGPVSTRQDSVDAHGLQRMQSSKAEAGIKFKERDYHSLASYTPDEGLPRVSNDVGDTYVDNKIVLHIARRSENMLDKTLIKNDFSSVVDARSFSKSILEGVVYGRTTPEGIVYAASICYPQTDLYVPLSITVTADGEVNIKKVGMLEDDYTEETPEQTYGQGYKAFLAEELHKYESI